MQRLSVMNMVSFNPRVPSGNDKTRNKTEEKQEITFLNNFRCFFYILYLFSSFRKKF